MEHQAGVSFSYKVRERYHALFVSTTLLLSSLLTRSLYKIIIMLRLYFIFVAATIVNSVPYFNDLGEDVGSLQNAPVYNEDVDNSDRLSNTNVNPVDDSFANFENTVPLNIALDQCDPNSQGKGSGACRSNVELAPKTPVYTGDTPQSPRSGVSPMPGIIPGANKRPSDRECVNFEGRPVFASCGGPEFYTEGDLAYDSIVVMNCVPSTFVSTI